MTPVAIRQTLRGVRAYTLNSDGSYDRCIVNHETSQGDVLLTARYLYCEGYGRQFRLDLMGLFISMDSIPYRVCGVANTIGSQWDVIPFECLVGIPEFENRDTL